MSKFDNVPENATKLVVDVRAILYGAFYWARNHYDVDNATDMQCAMLMRFFDKLKMAMQYTKTNRIIFACDSKTSKRKELLERYKTGRYKDEHFLSFRDFFTCVHDEILPYMGFKNVYTAEGLEADDIMASIAIKEERLPVVLFTEDADLYQCLKHNVFILSPSRGSVMDVARFTRIYDMPPERWIEVKSIAGCDTDRVPGVPRIGEKLAIKYLKGTLPKGIMKARIEESGDVIAFTRKLVEIPFEGKVLDYTWVPDEFNIKHIIEVSEKYNLVRSFDAPFWDKFFGATK